MDDQANRPKPDPAQKISYFANVLPDVPGHTLLPEFAAQRPGLPIIVYSGASGLKDRFKLYASGASAGLPKPTRGQDLLDVVEGLIESPPEPIR
jgi:DNA-binding NtrC family response regulator